MYSQKISDIAEKKSPESIQEAANVYFEGDSLEHALEAFTAGFEEGMLTATHTALPATKVFLVELYEDDSPDASPFAVAYFFGTEESVLEKLNKLEDAEDEEDEEDDD